MGQTFLLILCKYILMEPLKVIFFVGKPNCGQKVKPEVRVSESFLKTDIMKSDIKIKATTFSQFFALHV